MSKVSTVRLMGALVGCVVVAVSCGADDNAKSVQEAGGAGGAGGEADASVNTAGDRSGSAGGMEQPGTGGTGAEAGTPAGGSGGRGEPGLAGAPGEEAGAGGSGPSLSCADFTPPPPATSPVNVRLINNTNHNIYLGSPSPTCEYYFGFQLFQGQTELAPSRDACDFECRDLQAGECTCPYPCVPLVTLVSPGSHFDVGWPSTVFTRKKMPANCLDAACTGTSCLVEEAAPTGPLTISATAYDDKVCSGNNCDCTAGVAGSCIVSGAVRTSGTALKSSAQWMGQNLVQLSFVDP